MGSKQSNSKTTTKTIRVKNWIHDPIQQIAKKRYTDFSKITNCLLAISLQQTRLYNQFHGVVKFLRELQVQGATKGIYEDELLDRVLSRSEETLQALDWLSIVSLKKSYKKETSDLRWISRRLCKLLREMFDK